KTRQCRPKLVASASVHSSSYSGHRLCRWLLTPPSRLGFESVHGARLERLEQRILDHAVISRAAQQGFEVERAFVVEACSEHSLCSNTDAVTRAAEGAGESCDDTDASFVTRDVIMICCSKRRIRNPGNVGKMGTEMIKDF